MNEQEFDPQELNEEQLLDLLTRSACASYAGELTEKEAAQLNLLLEKHASARQIFLALAQDTHALRTWATVEAKRNEPASALPEDAPSNAVVRFDRLVSGSRSVGGRLFSSRMSRFVAFGIAGMLVAVMALPWLLGKTARDGVETNENLAQATSAAPLERPKSPVPRTPEKAAPVSVVSKRSVDSPVTLPLATGKPSGMPSGVSSVKLESGTANLTLPGVGYVIVDGPATFDLIGPMRARLNSGRIKMHVTEKSGHGFVVETPYGDVTDLGTEFGLDVPESGAAGLVVFDGAVDLRVKQQDQAVDFSRVQRLVRGEGVQFGKEGQTDRIMSIITGTVPTFQRHRHADEDDFLHPILAVGDNLRSSETKKFYEIVPGGLREDALAYVDRPSHQWNGLTASGMPAFLQNADYVKTFNDDKMRTDVQVEVMLGRPSRLFVFYDRRLTAPDWLKRNFRDTGHEIGQDLGRISPSSRFKWNAEAGAGKSIDLSFSVWERIVAEPGIVQLGPTGNEKRRAAAGMYGIAAVALEPEQAVPSENRKSDGL